MQQLQHYGQYKYSIMRKSTRPEWRILDYLECMRDWSDPEWLKYYGEAISNYVTILNDKPKEQMPHLDKAAAVFDELFPLRPEPELGENDPEICDGCLECLDIYGNCVHCDF